MKRCPQCYTEFPDKYRFCQHDRTPLVEIEVSPLTKSVQEAQKAFATQVDNLKPTAKKIADETRRRYPLVLAWSKRHIFLLSSIAVGIVVLVVLYYVFIKPKPGADGNKAALAFKACQNAYKNKVDTAYQTFLNEFAGKKYLNRGDAEGRINELLGNDRSTYDKCTQAAETQYQTLATRYSDSTDTLDFSNAFTAAGGERKSSSDIEGSSSFYSKIDENLASIRASYPESQRIINDLLGKTMDGWNFAYTSEFKEVKIVNTKIDGDTLTIRTHLNLEDYKTKEPRFAVLDLVYSVNPNGEWDYQNFTELLYTKPDVNYFIGNDIFLIGKWRWDSNTATYNPDGTWTGTWDNGSEAAGNWRIVNGNLVLTNNGQPWTSTKIVRFTKTELVIGESSPLRAERVQ